MLDLDRNPAGNWMTSVPTAFAAPLAEKIDQVLSDEAVAVINSAVLAAFEQLAAPIEFRYAMALLRTIRLLCKSDGFADSIGCNLICVNGQSLKLFSVRLSS